MPRVPQHGSGKISDMDVLLTLQEKYADAILAREDLPLEIMAKYQRMQELSAKVFGGVEPNLRNAKELMAIASELLPYFHFKISDMNWEKQ